MIVFEGAPGRVVAFNNGVPATMGPLIKVSPEGDLGDHPDDHDGITFNRHQSIITRIAANQKTSQQIQNTFGNDIYLYVFGDEIQGAVISGLSFNDNCGVSGSDGRHGVAKIQEWYNRYKVSSRPSPIAITLGRSTKSEILRGFLTGLRLDTIDPKNWVVQFDLNMILVPPPPKKKPKGGQS